MVNDITVIMPVYNRANTVQRSISSIRNLFPLRVNVVIVDDASTDASVDECISSLRKYSLSGHVYTSEVNAGPAAARNCGIAKVNTPWLIFLDSDDEFLIGAGNAIKASIESGQNFSMHSFGYIVNGYQSPQYHGATSAFLSFIKKKFFNTNTCVLRCADLGERRFREGYRIGEDTDFWARLLFDLSHKHTNVAIAKYNLEHKVRIPEVHPFFDVTLPNMNIDKKVKDEILSDHRSYILRQRVVNRDISLKELWRHKRVLYFALYLMGPRFYGLAWNISRWLKK